MGNKKIVLFNGAPNCGKDASASIMKDIFGCGAIHSFKDALYVATAEHFGVELEKFKEIARDRVLKEAKNRILKHKGNTLFAKVVEFIKGLFTNTGISPRQAMIYVSENLIKPNHGKDYFGKILANTVNLSNSTYFFIPDSGFVDELKPLVEAGHDIYVVRIHREGCTFANDSRSFMTDEVLADLGLKGYDIENDGTLEDLQEKLLNFATGTVLSGSA